jgi:hypothetical protein
MNWLDTHQGLVETAGIAVLVLVLVIVLVALVKALRQGRRAMFGAHPVIGPPEFGTSVDGGLVLIVPFANAAASPAYRFSARVKADRVDAGAPAGTVTLFGYGADPEANRVRIAFDWPVGILDADITVRWSWRDDSGTYDGSWRGHMRVPEPDMPDDSDPFAALREDDGDAGDEAPREATPDPAAVAHKPRVDPLSHVRGGTAKSAKPAEPGE